jgi:hypothetical protein
VLNVLSCFLAILPSRNTISEALSHSGTCSLLAGSRVGRWVPGKILSSYRFNRQLPMANVVCICRLLQFSIREVSWRTSPSRSMVGFCLLILSLGMREHGRGDYESHRSRPPLRKRRLVLRLPRGTSRYSGRPTIPNDYSSTTTIPKLNFRFPERTVTMQEAYADSCREGHRWGRELE